MSSTDKTVTSNPSGITHLAQSTYESIRDHAKLLRRHQGLSTIESHETAAQYAGFISWDQVNERRKSTQAAEARFNSICIATFYPDERFDTDNVLRVTDALLLEVCQLNVLRLVNENLRRSEKHTLEWLEGRSPEQHAMHLAYYAIEDEALISNCEALREYFCKHTMFGPIDCWIQGDSSIYFSPPGVHAVYEPYASSDLADTTTFKDITYGSMIITGKSFEEATLEYEELAIGCTIYPLPAAVVDHSFDNRRITIHRIIKDETATLKRHYTLKEWDKKTGVVRLLNFDVRHLSEIMNMSAAPSVMLSVFIDVNQDGDYLSVLDAALWDCMTKD